MSRDFDTPEERLRDLGIQLVVRFAAVMRIAALYEPRNAVVIAQIEQFERLCREVCKISNEVVLVALGADLYLNGVRIPAKSAHYKFAKGLVEEFEKRRIAGVSLSSAFDQEEVVLWFEALLGKEPLAGEELLAHCKERGLGHVMPVLHVSTEAIDQGSAGGANAAAGSGNVSAIGTGPRGGASRRNHTAAVNGTRAMFQNALQHGFELRHAKRVVQPIVDAADAADSPLPEVVGLTSLRQHDEYTYTHAVNVCSVSVTIGQLLGLDRRALADLGVAALFHDVGKAAVADEVRHSIDHFTPEEWRAVQRHPLEGAKLIAKTTELNTTSRRCARVALEHHLIGAKGYPAALRGKPTSVLSRIVAVADTYVSFQMHRSERGQVVTPHEALAMTLKELRGHVEDAMLWGLVKAIGVYPPGQLVELDDGTIAIAVAPNPEDPARPSVRVVCDAIGRLLAEPEQVLLKPLPEERVVLRALAVEDYPAAFRDAGEREAEAA